MIAPRSVRRALDGLERALVHSGDSQLRKLVLEGRPSDSRWPADLPPLDPELQTWLSWRRDEEDMQWLDVPEPNEPFCRLLSLERAADLTRELRDAGELVGCVPVLGDSPCFVCDAAGAVLHIDWRDNDDPEPIAVRVLIPIGVDLPGLIDRITAGYVTRRSSPWCRVRIAPESDSNWSTVTGFDVTSMEHAPEGSALAWSVKHRTRRRAWIAVKINDRWATSMTSWDDPAQFTSDDVEQACHSLRSSFGKGDIVSRTGDDLVTEIEEMRADRSLALVRGKLHHWTQPSVADLLDRLDAFRQRMPELRFAAGAKPEELALLTERAGHVLPDDLRALYCYANGSEGAVFWRYHLQSIAATTTTMKSMMQLRADQFGPAYWDRSFVPFLDKGNGDNLYVDLAGVHGPEGCVIDFDHERPAVRKVLYDSVTQWLECVVDGLESGLYEWADEAVFPCDFVELGEIREARDHDAVRTNGVYPWTRQLALTNDGC